jgi:Pentapeptide repeats (8 copies)
MKRTLGLGVFAAGLALVAVSAALSEPSIPTWRNPSPGAFYTQPAWPKPCLPYPAEKCTRTRLPNWSGKNFSRFDLSAVDIAACDTSCFGKPVRHRALLVGTNLKRSFVANGDWTGVIARKANFTRALAGGIWLVDADLSGANFTGADLRNANLEFANLTGAIFKGANLTTARLTGAKIAGANFAGAKLCYATMPDGSTKKC